MGSHAEMLVPVYDPSSVSKRDAVQRACDQCRATKQKCDGLEHCSRCLAKGAPCSYLARNKKNYTRAPPEHGQVQRRRIGVRVASEENGKLGGSGGGGGGGEVAQDGGPNRRHSTGPTGSASTRQGAPSIIKDAGSRSVKSTAAVGKSHKRKSSAPGPFVALPSALLQPGGPHRPTTEAEDEGESIESAGEGEALELQAAWRLRTSSATSPVSYASHSPHTSYFSPTYASSPTFPTSPSATLVPSYPYPSPPYTIAPFASAPCSPTYSFLAELAAFGPLADKMPEPMRKLNINVSESMDRSTLGAEEQTDERERLGEETSLLGLFGLGGLSTDPIALEDDNDVQMEDPFEGYRSLPPLQGHFVAEPLAIGSRSAVCGSSDRLL